MRARLALLTLAACALGACAGRDRANPFDPANQTTQGRPIGFAALARDARVELVWQSPGTPGLVGYEVWRRTATEADYHLISATLKPNVTRYTDRGLLNGLDHAYRLFYVFASGEGPGPAEDVATPGPQVPWVADGTGSLLEVAADGRHVAVNHGGFARPSGVAVDSTTHHVWCSDPDAAEVRIIDAFTGVTLTVPLSGTVGAIAVVPGDSSAWVCREDAGEVAHLSPRGQVLQSITGLQLPLGVAVSPIDGSVWVCDRRANRLEHRDPELGNLGAVALQFPSRVAVDAQTGEVWVTSLTQATVWKLSPDGTSVTAFGGFFGPVGIAIDATRGSIWVADPTADRVRVLARDGSERFTVTGLPGARSVALDPVTGEAWIAAISSGEVIRIAPGGTVTQRLVTGGVPNDIALLR